MSSKTHLTENEAGRDPIRLFRKWYEDHMKSVKVNPEAFSLATSSKDGEVSLRTVLLKEYSEKGFVFYTNYKSRKGSQLLSNPKAAILFYWAESGRQVRIEGPVRKVDADISEEYFHSRPVESQLSSWASEQSTVIPDRNYLDERFQLFKKKYSGSNVDRPPSWGGFILNPVSIEFWQEGEYRLHDRLVYKRIDTAWSIFRLSP